jgi:hypothetical protein
MAPNDQNNLQAAPPPNVPVVTVPDAVIFIPGIGREAGKYPLDEISLLLANALDNADRVVKAKFRVGEIGAENLPKSGETQTATIFREEAGREVAVAKVFGMNYNDELLGRFQGLPLIAKFLLLPLTLIPLTRTWTSIRNGSMSGREKLQFLLLTVILLSLFFYGFLLIGTAINSIRALPSDSAAVVDPPVSYPSAGVTPSDAASIDENNTWVKILLNPLAEAWSFFKPLTDLIILVVGWFSKLISDIAGFVQANASQLVLWATLVGLAIPTRAQVQEALENGTTILMGTIQYLWLGWGRPRVRGRFNDLLQDILESPVTGDARIHVLTHSFGSILAMDTLFRSDLAVPESFKRIGSLVTIGSPFDFIHMVWPGYFKDRKKIEDLWWVNIFAPQDVLSSNFRKDSKAKTAGSLRSSPAKEKDLCSVEDLVPNLNLVYRPTDARDELGLIDILTFFGLRSHLLYWEHGKKSHSNVFELAIPEMFGNRKAQPPEQENAIGTSP